MRRVGVFGNGLSISANPAFATAQLTQAAAGQLQQIQLDGHTLLDLIRAAGRHLVPEGEFAPDTNFEHLLGPLDRLAVLLAGGIIPVVAELDYEGRRAFVKAALGIRRVYQRGVGAVLQAVDAAATAADLARVRQVTDWMLAPRGDDDQLSVFTISYDPLIDRAMLDLRGEAAEDPDILPVNFDDEFAGFANDTLHLPERQIEMLRWRRNAPRIAPTNLFHLHGGMHWVAWGRDVWKPATIAELRNANVWERWMTGQRLPIRPRLILTDQKTDGVDLDPFADSYRQLAYELERADRVLLGGYAFGDRPLNRALAAAWRSSRRPAGSRWLVVTSSTADQNAFEGKLARELADGDRHAIPRTCYAGLPGVAVAEVNFWN